jgi:hypothetical protein
LSDPESLGTVYREGRVYVSGKVLADIVTAHVPGASLQFDGKSGFMVTANTSNSLGEPIVVNSRSYFDVSELLSAGLRLTTSTTPEQAGTDTTTPATTDRGMPAQPASAYRVGDALKFKNFTVTVTGMRYSSEWADLRSDKGRTFAIVSLTVDTGSVPVDPLMSPVLLVHKWKMQSGESYGGDGFAPGTVPELRRSENRTIEVGHSVTEGSAVSSVTIGSPYGEDGATTYTVELP